MSKTIKGAFPAVLTSEQGYQDLLKRKKIQCLKDPDGNEIYEYAALKDGVAYTAGPELAEAKVDGINTTQGGLVEIERALGKSLTNKQRLGLILYFAPQLQSILYNSLTRVTVLNLMDKVQAVIQSSTRQGLLERGYIFNGPIAGATGQYKSILYTVFDFQGGIFCGKVYSSKLGACAAEAANILKVHSMFSRCPCVVPLLAEFNPTIDDRPSDDRACLLLPIYPCSLSSLVNNATTGVPDMVAPIALSLCAALHAVHLAGLCHGDVKPSNICLTSSSSPPKAVLIDFAGAQPLGGPEEKLETTELYRVDSPPETTVAFDLLCVATTIYHLGVGQIPPSPKGKFVSAASAGSTLTMKIVRACLQPNATAMSVFRFILDQQPGLKLWAEEELLPIAKA